jgi:hypothetical protein
MFAFIVLIFMSVILNLGIYLIRDIRIIVYGC